MFEQMYHETFAHVQAPAELKQEVLAMANWNEQKRPVRRSRRLALILAAAVLLTVSGLAATWRLWQPKMAELFRAGPETQQELLDSGTTQVLGLSDSDNGVTLTAEQIIGDDNGFFILFRIDSDDPELLNYMVNPRLEVTYNQGLEDLMYSSNWRYVREGQQVWDEETGGFVPMTPMYFYWQGHVRDGADLAGRTITFTIDELADYLTDGNGVRVWNGHLELTLPLDYEPADTLVLDADARVDTCQGQVHIIGVEFTPISVVLCFEAQAQTDLLDVKALTLADGSVVELISSSGTAYRLEDGAYRQLFDLKTALVLEDAPVSLTLEAVTGAEELPNDGWLVTETTQCVVPLTEKK